MANICYRPFFGSRTRREIWETIRTGVGLFSIYVTCPYISQNLWESIRRDVNAQAQLLSLNGLKHVFYLVHYRVTQSMGLLTIILQIILLFEGSNICSLRPHDGVQVSHHALRDRDYALKVVFGTYPHPQKDHDLSRPLFMDLPRYKHWILPRQVV